MEKSFILIAALVLSAAAYAQENTQEAAAAAAAALQKTPEAPVATPKPKYWEESLKTNINFTQTSLTRWAAGGFNNVTLGAYIDGNANYAKEKLKWTNRLQLDYGFLYSEDKPIMQKVKDQIYFQSNAAYDTPVRNLFYSADFSFKTQFGNNYNYVVPTDEQFANASSKHAAWKEAAKNNLKSGLFSPAYVNLGIGIKWTPTKWLTVNASPLTGGFVIVDNADLRKTFGMDLHPRFESESAPLGYMYRASRFELGAQLKADAAFKINDNLEYSTQLVLFSNYLKNPQNIRVNWDNRFFWKLAKYFTLTLSTNLIYDDTIRQWEKTRTVAGEEQKYKVQAVQFKEFLEFGFTYTIASKK